MRRRQARAGEQLMNGLGELGEREEKKGGDSRLGNTWQGAKSFQNDAMGEEAR